MKLALCVVLLVALGGAAVCFPRELKAKEGQRTALKYDIEELKKELEAADTANDGGELKDEENVKHKVKRQLGYFFGNQGYGGYGGYRGYGNGYGNRGYRYGSSESFESGERGGYRHGYYPGIRYGSSESIEG